MQIYLPIAEISVNIFLILGLGGGVGFLSGLFGVGGGFLITPLLIFYGIPPAVSVATAANQIVASSVSGVFAHWRRGNVDLKMGLVLLFGGIFGSIYFGIFANITPPVCLAAFAGAGISGGDPMKTGFLSLKLALAGFIVPFMFIYNPTMLMIDPTGLAVTAKDFPLPPIVDILTVVVTSIMGVIALSSALEGYFRGEMNTITRIILAIGALLLIYPELMTGIVGGVIVLGIALWNVRSNKAPAMA